MGIREYRRKADLSACYSLHTGFCMTVRASSRPLVRHRLMSLSEPLCKALRRRDTPSMLRPDYLHLWTLARNMRLLCRGVGGGRILDVGCGDSPYRSFLPSDGVYVRLDSSPERHPDIVADARNMPIDSCSFDCVLCNQVIDFVGDPRGMIEECCRALKPGGRFIVSTPLLWPCENHARDRYRYTVWAMEELLSSFADVRFLANGKAWQTAIQIWAYCFFHVLGAAGAPIYLLGNTIGRLPGMTPCDSLITTGYTISARKLVH